MQRKRRIKHINGLGRKKAAVESAGNSGGEVRAVGIGGEALLHADAAVGREELEEGVEVIGGQIGEECWELRRVAARRLMALDHVADDEVHHVYGVAPTRAAEVRHHERRLRRAQTHAVEGFSEEMEHRSSMLRLHTHIQIPLLEELNQMNLWE